MPIWEDKQKHQMITIEKQDATRPKKHLAGTKNKLWVQHD